ncbi:hypothetical protein D3C72_926230 [compost metagenome]
MVDQADATLTGKKSVPCGLYRIADRRQHAQSGHNYSTLRHVCPPRREKYDTRDRKNLGGRVTA